MPRDIQTVTQLHVPTPMVVNREPRYLLQRPANSAWFAAPDGTRIASLASGIALNARASHIDALLLKRVSKQVPVPMSWQAQPNVDAIWMGIGLPGKNGSCQGLPGTRFTLNV